MSDRRKRDKEQTIQEVLKAATSLFSAKGLHGTSIRDIEKASGISKGLIMHHFETKEKLYAAVQDNLNQTYIAWMAAQRDASKDLLEAIETGIKSSLTYLNSHEEFRRIVLWSYLEGQGRTTELDKRFTASLIDSMEAGQDSGLVRNDVKTFVLPFIIRGAIEYWLRSKSLRGELYAETQHNDTLSDEDLVDALVKLLVK